MASRRLLMRVDLGADDGEARSASAAPVVAMDSAWVRGGHDLPGLNGGPG